MMKNYGLQGLSLIENDEFLFSLSYHSNNNDIGTAEARREKSLRNSEMIRMNAAPVLISGFFFLFAKRRKQRKEFSEDFVVKRSEGANQ